MAPSSWTRQIPGNVLGCWFRGSELAQMHAESWLMSQFVPICSPYQFYHPVICLYLVFLAPFNMDISFSSMLHQLDVLQVPSFPCHLQNYNRRCSSFWIRGLLSLSQCIRPKLVFILIISYKKDGGKHCILDLRALTAPMFCTTTL